MLRWADTSWTYWCETWETFRNQLKPRTRNTPSSGKMEIFVLLSGMRCLVTLQLVCKSQYMCLTDLFVLLSLVSENVSRCREICKQENSWSRANPDNVSCIRINFCLSFLTFVSTRKPAHYIRSIPKTLLCPLSLFPLPSAHSDFGLCYSSYSFPLPNFLPHHRCCNLSEQAFPLRQPIFFIQPSLMGAGK